MRYGRGILLLLVSLAAFCLSFWLFFPFGDLAETAWNTAVLSASQQGFRLDAAGVSAEGRFPPTFVLSNARMSSPLLSGEAGRADITPSVIESVLKMAPAAAVKLDRVSVNLPVPGQAPLYLSSAEARTVFRNGRLEMTGVRTGGDLEISGTIVLSPASFKILESDLVIRGERSALLEYFRSILPLRKEGPETWVLKRGAAGRNDTD